MIERASGDVVGLSVGPSGAIEAELLDLFRALDPRARADLLAVARGLAALKLKTGDARKRRQN